jgi:hypothetical protein
MKYHGFSHCISAEHFFCAVYVFENCAFRFYSEVPFYWSLHDSKSLVFSFFFLSFFASPSLCVILEEQEFCYQLLASQRNPVLLLFCGFIHSVIPSSCEINMNSHRRMPNFQNKGRFFMDDASYSIPGANEISFADKPDLARGIRPSLHYQCFLGPRRPHFPSMSKQRT